MSKRWYWLAPSLRPNHLPKWRGRHVNAWFGIARAPGYVTVMLWRLSLHIGRQPIVSGRRIEIVWGIASLRGLGWDLRAARQINACFFAPRY